MAQVRDMQDFGTAAGTGSDVGRSEAPSRQVHFLNAVAIMSRAKEPPADLAGPMREAVH